MKGLKETGIFCLMLFAVAGCKSGTATETVEVPVGKLIKVNDNLDVVRITEHCFFYTGWADMGKWGRVGSNGLVVVDGGKACLIDSPVIELQTVELAGWFDKKLGVRFESFVPGHWHDDCVGGLPWLNRNGVKTYAYSQTNKLLAGKGMEQAKESFSDSLTIPAGNIQVKFYYFGGGHATDNIVAWVPSEKVLFGGCMLKDAAATSIGNTSDAAPFEEWLQTVQRTEKRFPAVKFVIPGHGNYGGKELFARTEELIRQQIAVQ